jgi:hypothetical protein
MRNNIEQDHLDAARSGLRQLVRRGTVSPAQVLASPDLIALASLVAPSTPGGGAAAATGVADAIVRATEAMPQTGALRALLGIDETMSGLSLRERRAAAAELSGVTPDSFRIRREPRLVDDLAHALLVELATGAAIGPEGAPDVPGENAYLVVFDTDLGRTVGLSASQSPVVIGRDPDCDIVIRQDPRVSRRHACLTLTDHGWSVSDAGSSNGTAVAGKMVRDMTLISDGDTILVGQTGISFHEPYMARTTATALLPDLRLSPREEEVLTELCTASLESSRPSKQPPDDRMIADRLDCSPAEVKAILGGIAQRARLVGASFDDEDERVQLVGFAIRHRLVTKLPRVPGK